jgi:hypothetical protein
VKPVASPVESAAESTQTATKHGHPGAPRPRTQNTSSETCLIDWSRGYIKSQFYAKALGIAGQEYVAETSPLFRWNSAAPPERTEHILTAHRALVEALLAQGWKPIEPAEPTQYPASDRPWFEQLFQRRPLPTPSNGAAREEARQTT